MLHIILIDILSMCIHISTYLLNANKRRLKLCNFNKCLRKV